MFGVARGASYLFWVSATSVAATSLRDVITPRFGSGAAIAVQLAGFVLLIALMQVDWRARLARWTRK